MLRKTIVIFFALASMGLIALWITSHVATEDIASIGSPNFEGGRDSAYLSMGVERSRPYDWSRGAGTRYLRLQGLHASRLNRDEERWAVFASRGRLTIARFRPQTRGTPVAPVKKDIVVVKFVEDVHDSGWGFMCGVAFNGLSEKARAFIQTKETLVTRVSFSIWVPSVLAALFPVMSFVRGPLRRRHRWRRGRCPLCNYDLTGNVSGLCTECGTPVPAKRLPPSRPLGPPIRAAASAVIALLGLSVIVASIAAHWRPVRLTRWLEYGRPTWALHDCRELRLWPEARENNDYWNLYGRRVWSAAELANGAATLIRSRLAEDQAKERRLSALGFARERRIKPGPSPQAPQPVAYESVRIPLLPIELVALLGLSWRIAKRRAPQCASHGTRQSLGRAGVHDLASRGTHAVTDPFLSSAWNPPPARSRDVAGDKAVIRTASARGL